MKYLFIHQNFPGQYLHIVKHLVKNPENEVVFISQAHERGIPGVRSVFYSFSESIPEGLHPALKEIEQGVRRADEVKETATTLKRLGFTPDIIIGHQGWGEMLHLTEVYPDVPILGYFEFYYHIKGLDVDFDPEFPVDDQLPSRVRIKNTINLLSLTNSGWGQTPTLFQWSIYPEWARKKISVLREGVDLDICKPDPAIFHSDFVMGDFVVHPNEKLVTYVARGLEPYRGFHIMMRALPRLLRERQDIKVIIVGRDEVSYGASLEGGISWREYYLRKLESQLDMSRILFAGQTPYSVFTQLLKRSDAHVYLTYPFVLSWSLREAMATGCAIIASDTAPVKEFIADRTTGILTPFLKPASLTDRILEVLEDQNLAQAIRKAAREEAERSLSMEEYLKNYETLIAELIAGRNPQTHFGRSPAEVAILAQAEQE